MLYEQFSSWSALVNIAGSEYPIQDNLAIVEKYLRSKKTEENGVTLERYPMTESMFKYRLKFYWEPTRFKKTKKRRPPIPFKLKLYKGQRSGIFDRDWIWFLLYHPVSRIFLIWSKNGGHIEVQLATFLVS